MFRSLNFMGQSMRFIAGITLFFFTASTLAWAEPVRLAVEPEPKAQFTLPAHFELPSKLGSIESQVLTGNPQKPLILHLQDAHAVRDAQAHIQKLIQYFGKTYGIRLVAVEGAHGTW